METIYIPQLLKAPEKTETIQVQEFLPDLETLTPVRGWLKVKHCGNYLEVSATAETIITLTCHRCLQQYNYRLVVDTSEIIWLDEAAEQTDILLVEREIAVEDLVETLPPRGFFEPNQWLYEQLCLELPQRQLCDAKCSGIQPESNENSTALIDKRWASLQALKKDL
ncbi:DUF177 domain-containing protein [Chroococcidiopsis sp. TS-821]|nr:metal-binding protein [Chroococcidiopsis sp. TS-821]